MQGICYKKTSLSASITNAKIVKNITSFLRYCFYELKTNSSIMALFITIFIHYPQDIHLKALRPYFIGGCIDSNNKSIKVKIPLFVFFLLKSLFKLFLSFFRVLHTVREIICKLKFLGLWLIFLNTKIFYSSALDLSLDCGNVSRTYIL